MNDKNEAIKCNKCGKEFDTFDTSNNYSIHRKIGYGSVHDGDLLGLHLCCGCMDELIASCVISPITELL